MGIRPHILGVAVALCSVDLATAEPVSELTHRLALSIGFGSTGADVQAAFKVTPQFVVRAEGDYLEFRDAFKSSDVRYAGRAHLSTWGGYVDWHPFGNAWLISGGAAAGRRKIGVAANSLSGTIKINGVTYTASQIGSVQGRVDLGDAAPFVGLGWDNTFTGGGPIGFRALAGVLIGPTPKVTLTPTGPFATDPVVLANVAAEQSSLQRDARDLQYYPVVQMGLNYRF